MANGDFARTKNNDSLMYGKIVIYKCTAQDARTRLPVMYSEKGVITNPANIVKMIGFID